MAKKSNVEGIVVKVTETTIVLLSSDGSFRNVGRPEKSVPLIGEQYIHIEAKQPWLKFGSMVAVVFLAIFSYAFFSFEQENYSYVVAMDINPSIELTLNEEMIVMKTTAYNEEGETLLSSIDVNGMTLTETLEKVISYSVDAGYLTYGDGFLETSVISLKRNGSQIEEIEKSIQATITPLEIDVKVNQNNKATYDEAKNMDVSVNKLNYLKELEDEGVIESREIGKGKTVAELRKMQNTQRKADKNEDKKQDPSEKGQPTHSNGKNQERDQSGNNGNKPDHSKGNNQDSGKNGKKPDRAEQKDQNNGNQNNSNKPETPPGKKAGNSNNDKGQHPSEKKGNNHSGKPNNGKGPGDNPGKGKSGNN
ncbi:anti-sigma-I factor RsgI family protein [Anaerobacillus isosaccharinicus]|uniref:RsgI N-terminal anti-sigma domain-containing protein n=1 Tax=Anaerobacillus isosaccharinicus TaxID=1532552 RepID=A0A1S2KW38_9BACI|nr:hypothetical protein [Anaerobacillus isosaccharinicus]MBA5584780.1 hypothetical protein [Anaerobacillus isosaccharinicus]QOY36855.1 hypothetical protein AWH56_004155 [Anaerobacillus isosaccharinicus]